MNRVPTWLSIAQASATTGGVVVTTIGVLVALWVAIANSKKNREEREDRGRQLAALQRAEDDRIAAQARRVVPTVVRSTMFGPGMWSVKVSNHSAAPITELEVSVVALDTDGNKIPDGCEEANGQMGTHEAFRKLIEDAISGSVDGVFSRVALPLDGTGIMRGSGLGPFALNGGRGIGSLVGRQSATEVSEAMKEALSGQFTAEWPTTLTPEQVAVMAFSASEVAAKVQAVITFMDEAGYRWERADNAAPTIIQADK